MENTLYAIGCKRHFEIHPNYKTSDIKFQPFDTAGKVLDYFLKKDPSFEMIPACGEILAKAIMEINRLQDREWIFPRFIAYWHEELCEGSYLCEIIEGVHFDWDINHFLRTIFSSR